MSEAMMNGVDRNALFATIDAVKADNALAKFEFRIDNEWQDGGLNKTTVRDFYGTKDNISHEQVFELYNDEPPVLLSADKGPNPVENLLHALAGCLTTTIVYHAAAKGIPIETVCTRFEGDLDLRGFLGLSDQVRKGYSQVRAIFDIEGDMTVEQKRELMSFGPQFSPVFDVVSNGTNVSCEIVEDHESRVAA